MASLLSIWFMVSDTSFFISKETSTASKLLRLKQILDFLSSKLLEGSPLLCSKISGGASPLRLAPFGPIRSSILGMVSVLLTLMEVATTTCCRSSAWSNACPLPAIRCLTPFSLPLPASRSLSCESLGTYFSGHQPASLSSWCFSSARRGLMVCWNFWVALQRLRRWRHHSLERAKHDSRTSLLTPQVTSNFFLWIIMKL